MNRKSFVILINKYLNGKCNQQEKELVEKWYLLLGENSNEGWDESEIEERLWQKIKNQTIEPMTIVGQKSTKFYTKLIVNYGIAASIIVMLGLLILLFYNKENTTESTQQTFNKEEYIEIYNSDITPKKIELEDGSKVTLQPKSTLSYPKSFEKEKREVYLSGEGFFEVEKNPSKPFFVYAGRVATKVLGTSFYVKSYEDVKKVEVEVVSGRVSVYEKHSSYQTLNNQTNGVILMPNHKATFFTESKLFVTNIVENPIIQSPKIQDTKIFFEFDDAPLSQILNKLKEAYGIEITVENESMNKCLLTADITSQPLYTKLEIICAAIGATYEVKGTTILINGKGCE